MKITDFIRMGGEIEFDQCFGARMVNDGIEVYACGSYWPYYVGQDDQEVERQIASLIESIEFKRMGSAIKHE